MNAAEQATDLLAAQEVDSLASCIARGQAPDTYQDIVGKVYGHLLKLPSERANFWAEQCRALGIELFPVKPSGKGRRGAGTENAESGRSTLSLEKRP